MKLGGWKSRTNQNKFKKGPQSKGDLIGAAQLPSNSSLEYVDAVYSSAREINVSKFN